MRHSDMAYAFFREIHNGRDDMIITDSYLHFWGHDIPVYGLMFIFGFVLAIVSSFHRLAKYSFARSELAYAGVFAGLGGIIGAKALSILTSLPLIVAAFRAAPSVNTLRVVLQDGFVFYGGLIGGFGGILLYTGIFKLPAPKYCDVFAPSVALGHAFGRIGCLFSGCCYGMAVDSGWYVLYPFDCRENIANSISYLNKAGELMTAGVPLDTRLLPVPFLEAIILVFIFWAAEIVFLKSKKAGSASLTYVMSYAVVRFILEFFRADAERGVAVLSTSQWISLAIVVIGAAYIYFLYWQGKIFGIGRYSG